MRASNAASTSGLVLIALGLVLGPASVQAQDSDVGFGVKGGLVAPGCVYVEDSDCLDSDMGYSLGAFADYQLAPRLSGGLFADIHSIGGADLEDSETMFDLGFTIKALIGLEEHDLLLRPGFGLGYGMLSAMEEDLSFMTLHVPVEVMLQRPTGPSYGLELGLFTGPTGGSENVDVTFGPGMLARATVAF